MDALTVISRFRTSAFWKNEEKKLRAALQQHVSMGIMDVMLERRFLIFSEHPLTSHEETILDALLCNDIEPHRYSIESQLAAGVVEVGPRRSIITPWSTNAVAICRNIGLHGITRLEETRRIQIVLEEDTALTPERYEKLYELSHDRMTEEMYRLPSIDFLSHAPRVADEPILLMERGPQAVFETVSRYGLGIDEKLAGYVIDYYTSTGYNPTLTELFGFAQLNSDHCRHRLFNGQFIIDGQKMEKSLFDLIRDTMRTGDGNVLSAYRDNAALFAQADIQALIPTDPTIPSPYGRRDVRYAISLKAETHNHPTTICAFPGAATGTGGEIRDRQMAGRGGIPRAGLACYYVGHLFIPQYPLPWEQEYAPHVARFQTPLEIAIQASNGASDYGNKFGQPLILGSFRSFEHMFADGEHYGYRKTVMVAGGCGHVDVRHAEKRQSHEGDLIIQLGGDAYWIGVGGGSASSKDAGSQSADLDFDSVQRENPEMQTRINEVVRACSELGDENPLITCTDLGAGGESVALTEIAYPMGARYDLKKIPSGDPTMPLYVLWCNESQERVVVIVAKEDYRMLAEICERNRCPYVHVGEITSDEKLVVEYDDKSPDPGQTTPVDVHMNFLLADLPKLEIHAQTVSRELLNFEIQTDIAEALNRVLRNPAVACKYWLVRKVDRSVGGLVARQQCVGLLHLPLADCAVTADGYAGTTGTAISIGERPIIGLIDVAASVRMSIGEALLNLVSAPIDDFDSINFSATWQWPCKQPGEDARLYHAVQAARDLCVYLGLRIPVGKDSTSMTAVAARGGKKHLIKAPGTVQFIACAPCSDIRAVCTPDIKQSSASNIVFIDIARGQRRMGGSVLAQCFSQIGDEAPDMDDPDFFQRAWCAINELVRTGVALSVHDKSEGGLMTCVLEMVFAGDCGMYIDLPDIPVDDVVKYLFNEELGVVFEYNSSDAGRFLEIVERHHVADYCHVIGYPMPEKRIVVRADDTTVYHEALFAVRGVWLETSAYLDALQTDADHAQNDFIVMKQGRRSPYTRVDNDAPMVLLPNSQEKPRVAVLREEGTNGHRELAAAFFTAGFDVYDVTLSDIANDHISLSKFKGIAVAGGFSFGDVLDAGKGMAAVMRFNASVRRELDDFLDRDDTFTFGVCNGCQVLTLLGVVPWRGVEPERQPRFVRNTSGIFESRFSTVVIEKSPSLFFKGMEGSRLGIWVAHGEGRCVWPDETLLHQALNNHLAPMRFIDDTGEVTQQYPYNPNGSPYGITALCSPDGRHLVMMPHAERLFLRWQWPHWPAEWSEHQTSPWLSVFQNAYNWCASYSITH
ncbi:phosphoribosylformylglycinamidine synthase [Candidatus Uhrbacteria bacterium]|nr:phosphoribosylformylglycinamidine synthase [Candidatus Uhrbacteria bacterium]